MACARALDRSCCTPTQQKHQVVQHRGSEWAATNYEGLLLALALTGDGYIVVAPNYAGYDSSALQYHAFLHADQQAADMMDALTAARTALPGIGGLDGLKLFITGYSQGGYVAMATHRALEAAGVPVTASAPMSGPYALSAFADAVFMGQVGRGAVEEVLDASDLSLSEGVWKPLLHAYRYLRRKVRFG